MKINTALVIARLEAGLPAQQSDVKTLVGVVDKLVESHQEAERLITWAMCNVCIQKDGNSAEMFQRMRQWLEQSWRVVQ